MRVAAVQRDRAALVPGIHAVDVAAVDDEMLGDLRERRLARVAAAELEQVRARRRFTRQDFDELQTPVGGARGRLKRRAIVIRLDFRKQTRRRRCDPNASAGQRRIVRRIERGVEKGPSLGAALGRAEAAWIAAGFPLERKALNDIVNQALGG